MRVKEDMCLLSAIKVQSTAFSPLPLFIIPACVLICMVTPATSSSVWDYKHLAGHLLSSCYDKRSDSEDNRGEICWWNILYSWSPNVMRRHCNKIHLIMAHWCVYVIKKCHLRALYGLIGTVSLYFVLLAAFFPFLFSGVYMETLSTIKKRKQSLKI